MSVRTRLTCADTFLRLDDYVDRELNDDDRRLVEEHLETCIRCWKEFQFEATVVTALRDKVRRLAVPIGLRSALLHRITAGGSD